MSKINKAFKIFSLVMKQPALLNRVLQEPDYWEGYVERKYGLKKGLPVVDPAEIFGSGYSGNLSVFTFLDGGSLVTDILLLKNLAASFSSCRYFEIGTWRGESAVNVSEVAEEVFTLNLSDEELRERGLKEGYVTQQGFFSRHHKNITHLKGNSASFDFSSPGKKFDLVFIDGSHHYEDVKNDTKKVFRHLLHQKSIVVWHDYAVTPEDVRFEVLAGMLDGLENDQLAHLYHVGSTKSAIYTTQELRTSKLEKPVEPSHYYSLEINYHAVKEREI